MGITLYQVDGQGRRQGILPGRGRASQMVPEDWNLNGGAAKVEAFRAA